MNAYTVCVRHIEQMIWERIEIEFDFPVWWCVFKVSVSKYLVKVSVSFRYARCGGRLCRMQWKIHESQSSCVCVSVSTSKWENSSISMRYIFLVCSPANSNWSEKSFQFWKFHSCVRREVESLCGWNARHNWQFMKWDLIFDKNLKTFLSSKSVDDDVCQKTNKFYPPSPLSQCLIAVLRKNNFQWREAAL